MAMTAGLRAKYDRHIKSARWRNMRRDLMRWRGAKCERCGRAKVRLCLHHKTYARFGNETPTDVELLCCVCHKPADYGRRVMKQSATVLNFEAHRLHTLKRAGSELIWFVLADVCAILGILDPAMVAATLKPNQKGTSNIGTLGGPPTPALDR